MKTVYFDYPCVLLRTHLLLQEIKRYAGTKLFLYARMRLAELWTIIHKERFTRNWPNIETFLSTLNNLEKLVEYSERHKGVGLYGLTKENIDENLHFYKNVGRSDNHWYGVPVKIIENKTLYEAIKAIEKFNIDLQNGFDEIDDMVADFDWDEEPIEPFDF